MHGATGQTLAVHDHAAGKNQPPAKRPSPERFEQHRSTQVVVDHVTIDVLEGEAKADFCRLVADGVDILHGPADDGIVGQVPGDELSALVEVGRIKTIEHADVGTAVEKLLDDVTANKAGTASHQHSRFTAGSPPESGRRTVKRQPSPSLRTEISPRCASTRPLATATPSPAPPSPGVRAASPR